VKALVLAAALLGALWLAPMASAKGCVRIEAASDVSVGESVRVTVRTYASTWARGKVVPGAPKSLGIPYFTVTASGPGGRRSQFLARRIGDGKVRVARTAFNTPGMWRLTATNWKYAPRSCAPPAVVRVRALG
jgi:hypothetical protein